MEAYSMFGVRAGGKLALAIGLQSWYHDDMDNVNREIMKQVKKTRHPKVGTPVMIRLQDEPLDAIDAWRRQQPDIPNRSEAIRRLTSLALEAEAKKKGRGK